MKLIGNFNKFCLVVLVSFLVGFIGYFIFDSKTEYKNVNGTTQEFPIELTDDVTKIKVTVISKNDVEKVDEKEFTK